MKKSYILIIASFLLAHFTLTASNQPINTSKEPKLLTNSFANQNQDNRPDNFENSIDNKYQFEYCATARLDSEGNIKSSFVTEEPEYGIFFEVEITYQPNSKFPVSIYLNEIDDYLDLAHTVVLCNLNVENKSTVKYSAEKIDIFSDKYHIVFHLNKYSIIVYELNKGSYKNGSVIVFEESKDEESLKNFKKRYNVLKNNLKRYF